MGYDHSMLSLGLRAWETPGVVEFRAWLTSLVSEQSSLFQGRSLLTKSMALALWEEVISGDLELSSGAASIPAYRNSLVTLSFDAYSTLKEYQSGASFK